MISDHLKVNYKQSTAFTIKKILSMLNTNEHKEAVLLIDEIKKKNLTSSETALVKKLCSMHSLPFESKLKISVVTVVYNDVNGIGKTIESVRRLNWQNLEYIVIDGGSTDGTCEVIEKNQDFIDVYISEKDGGIFNAMNKSLPYCSGEYVIFMNSSDEFHSATIIDEVFGDKANENYDVIYGDRIYVQLDGEEKYQESKIIDTVVEKMPYCHQSVFIKKYRLLEYNFNEVFKYAADYNQAISLYKANASFKKLSTPICRYLAGGESESGLAAYLDVLKIQFDNFKSKDDLKKSSYLKSLILHFDYLTKEYK